MDSNAQQESITLSLTQTPADLPTSIEQLNRRTLGNSSNHYSHLAHRNISSPSFIFPSPNNLSEAHSTNSSPQQPRMEEEKVFQTPQKPGPKRVTLTSPKIAEIKNQMRDQSRNSVDNPTNLSSLKLKAIRDSESYLDSPFILKEYKYRKLDQDRPIVGEMYCAKPGERRNKRSTTFVPQNQAQPTQQNSPRRSSRTPPNNTANNAKVVSIAGRPGTARNSYRMSRMSNNASLIATSRYDGSSSDDDDRLKLLTEDQKRIRKIFKKGLHVAYFIGVMFSLRTRVKMFGAMRPIEYLHEFEAYKEEVPNYSRFPILPSSPFSLLWTFFIIILLIVTAILTPVYVSFVDDDDDTFYYLNLTFDIGFGIDILINFMSAYYDSEQVLVRDYRLIAINYLRAWFWIDLVAILPFDQIILEITQSERYSASGANKLLRLLRFPRLYRMLKIIRLVKMLRLFSNNQIISKIIKELNLNIGLTRILKIFINFAFLNHVAGCLWFFIAKLEDFTPDTWVGQAQLIDADGKSQYIASLYWAFQTLTTVGYGDITPGTQLERVICTWWPIFCVTVYSFLVGNLAAILLDFDKRSDALRDRISSLKSFALQANLPEFMRQKVQRFIEINHKENSYYMIDPSNMLKDLPVNLRTSLLIFSYYATIKNIKLLQVDPAFTASIVIHLKTMRLQQGEVLYREDDPAREVFFIASGSVKFMTERSKGIYSLSEGTYFGEIEVIERTKREFFCQSQTTTTLLICPEEAFLNALENFPSMEEQIKKVLKLRKARFDKKLEKVKDLQSPELKGSPAEKKILYKTTDYVNKILIKKSPRVARRRQISIPPMYIRSHVRLTGGSIVDIDKEKESRNSLLGKIRAIRAKRNNTQMKRQMFMKKAMSQVLPYKEDTNSDYTETNYMQSPTSLGLLKRNSNVESFDFTVSTDSKAFAGTMFDFNQSRAHDYSDMPPSQRRPLMQKQDTIFLEEEETSDKEVEPKMTRRVRFQETPKAKESPRNKAWLNSKSRLVFRQDLSSFVKERKSKESNIIMKESDLSN